MFKKALAITLSMLLAAPIWAMSAPIGSVAIGSGTTVAGTTAAPGTSLFSGDTVSVQQGAQATITLAGGSRVLFDGGSQARIVRDGSVLALELSSGGAAFTSSSKSLVEGRLADMTFRPLDPSIASVGYIAFKDTTHAFLYANKGAWVVTTMHDGHSTVLQPGTHVEGTLAPASQSQDRQNNKKKKKLLAFYIGLPLAGGLGTGLAFAFGQSECTLKDRSNGLMPSCALSPTTPSSSQ